MPKYLVVSSKGGVYTAKGLSLEALFDKDHVVAKRFVQVRSLQNVATLLHLDAIETVSPSAPLTEGDDTE